VLAVLGKQWLTYYLEAGRRGTLQERGLERQRKFDALRRWKFGIVVNMLPLLLQLALFVFTVALSIYLWSIHVVIAIVVLVMTTTGILGYLALVVLTALSGDSPYRSPLALALITVFRPLIVSRMWSTIRDLGQRSLQRAPHSLPCFSSDTGKHRDLPLDVLDTPEPHSLSDHLPKPSPEVSAVSWVLETSTDPEIVASAADLAIDLQWPVNSDLTPHLIRLREAFLACFNTAHEYVGIVTLKSLRAGMTLRAIQYGRAYCSLRLVHRSTSTEEPKLEVVHNEPFGSPELRNVTRILQGEPHLALDSDVPLATKWALHVIPSLHPYIPHYDTSDWTSLDYFLSQLKESDPSHLDDQTFCDYLFCVISILSPTSARDAARKDKRYAFREVEMLYI
jgi:hypothetical protein